MQNALVKVSNGLLEPELWHVFGRGLDADWTPIRRRFDADSTPNGRRLNADGKKGNYLLKKKGPMQFAPNELILIRNYTCLISFSLILASFERF